MFNNQESVQIVNADQIADQIVIDIPKNHDGSHFLTQEQNQYFELLYKDGNHKAALVYLKNCWRTAFDYEFIHSFKKVHWVAGVSEIREFLKNSRTQVEISCQAYSEFPFTQRWMQSGLGVLIEGPVTLAGNADLQTNQWSMFTKETGKKYTEYANRLFTNRQNCTSPYEFVVDDWKVNAIIFSADSKVDKNEVMELAREYGLPVLGTDGEPFAFE